MKHKVPKIGGVAALPRMKKLAETMSMLDARHRKFPESHLGAEIGTEREPVVHPNLLSVRYRGLTCQIHLRAGNQGFVDQTSHKNDE